MTDAARGPVWPVLALSAALGAVASIALYPMWTDNVESAQVVAGVVALPPGNPMAAYHTSVQSLQIWIPAALLRLGVTEWPLCLASIGVQGALSFAAVSALALALSGSAAVSLAVPVLLLLVRRWAPPWPEQDIDALHGHHYPVLFPAHASIFGVVGFFLLIAIVALYALGKRRVACTLAGLLPCIHPGFAPPALFGLAAGALFAGRAAWPARGELRWLFGGLAVSLALVAAPSLLSGTSLLPEVTPEARQLVEVFHSRWDAHNRPLAPGEWLAFFEPDLYFLAVLALLVATRASLSAGSRFVLGSFAALEAAGVGFVLWLASAPGWIPEFARYLIIGRLLNLSSIAWFCCALAALGGAALRGRGVLALLGFAGCAVFIGAGGMHALTGASFASLKVTALRDHPEGLLAPLGLIACLALATLAARSGAERRYPKALQRPLGALVAAATVVALAALVAARFDRDALAGRDRYDPLVAEIAKGDGLLLTPLDTWLIGRIQLRARRALLLDLTQLNLIGKVPAAAPAIEAILNEAHCASLRDAATYASLENAGLCWGARSLGEWQALRARLGVHDVLVEGTLRLDLPETYRGQGFGLYHIPEASPAAPAAG